jgi:HAD superfamily hydrolase (TIGR01509 family)
MKCYIFDMDGTITRTNLLIFDTFNYIARKYAGRTYTGEELIKMFGPPEEGALLNIVGPEQIDIAMKDYLVFYQQNHKKLADAYEGMEHILKYLKSKGKLVTLFTGKGTSTTSITLRELNFEKYFDYIVTGNDVVNHKPSAEGILKIVDKYSLTKDEAIMIGDSLHDVKAARQAGIKIAAALWDSFSKEKVLQMNPDFIFFTINEFEKWIRETE